MKLLDENAAKIAHDKAFDYCLLGGQENNTDEK